MHWVVFWVLHVSNIRYSKVLSVLKTIYCWISSPPIFFKCYKTIHTFYIPEKMHVQSKVTRFMSDYDFSVVGVPSAELTRLRIEGLNHEDNVAGCCCCQPVLSLYHRLPLGSCFYCWYRSIILQRRFPVRLLGVSEFSSHVDGKGWLVGIQGWDWCDVVMIWLGCLEILWSEKASFFLKNSCDRYGLFFLLCLIFSSILTLTSTV